MHDPHLHLVESHKKNWQNYLDSISGRTVLQFGILVLLLHPMKIRLELIVCS